MSASPYAPTRPRRLIVVVGTATEIGKTWVASRLLRELRAEGFTVAARKPAQSFSPDDSSTDAHHLSALGQQALRNRGTNESGDTGNKSSHTLQVTYLF